MAITAQEDFEGIADGTNLTTSNTTFNLITLPAEADTGQAHLGSVSALLGGAYGQLQWSTSSLNEVYFTGYVRIGSYGTSPDRVYVLNCYGQTGNVADLRIETDGQVAIRDGLTKVDDSGVELLTLGDWMRVDWYVNYSGGTQEARLFMGANVDGSTPDATLTGAARTNQGAIGRIGYATPSAAVGSTVNLDDAAYGDAWIGPLGNAPPSVPTNLGLEEISDTTADISWTESTDDSDAQASIIYRVYVDTVEHTNSPTAGGASTFQVTGLTANTEYDITVSAEDTDASESAQTTAMTIRTPTTATVGGTVAVGYITAV